MSDEPIADPAFGGSCPLPLSDYPTVQMAHGGGGRLSQQLIEGLLAMPEHLGETNEDFVVVPPGGEIVMDLFMRGGEPAPQPLGRAEKGG